MKLYVIFHFKIEAALLYLEEILHKLVDMHM